jgi:alkyldihydroxyacetonephosphate synthase
MKRWNGWGEETITTSLAAPATAFIQRIVGVATPPRDTTLAEMVAHIPPSRLPTSTLVSVDPEERLRHARGQSLPDLIALCSGCIDIFPDGVAYPASASEVRDLISYAAEVSACLIPYGGGTSVVGHITPLAGDRPVLTVDLRRMSRLRVLDETNHLATFEAGVTGSDLEAQLRAHGYTLGHYPQSFEYSTLGGWIATRSSGQQSLGYGSIDKLFAGGHIETPAGTLEIRPCPPSATGMDLREIVLGSEGRLGILTEATMHVRPVPEQEQHLAVFFPEWEQGITAVREMVQAQLPLVMLRLSTASETQTQLALAGHERVLGILERFLALRGAGDNKCMLLIGIAGQGAVVRHTREGGLRIARKLKGIPAGSMLGQQWHKKRFHTPYLRNTLWNMGYAVDTVETATTWDQVSGLTEAIETSLRAGLAEEGEQVHAFSHLSHVYPHGSAIYTTYLYRLAPDPQETLRRWQILKGAASEVIVAAHAAISHHHGIGIDHRPYLGAEKGALGLSAMRQLYAQFDPQGLMNPGKLV